MEQPERQRPVSRFIGVVRLPVDPDPPVRPRRVSRHRRQLPSRLVRSAEAGAWAAGVALVAAMAVFVAGAGPGQAWRAANSAAATTAAANSAATPAAPGPARPGSSPGPGAMCAFDSCADTVAAGKPTRLRIDSIGVDTPLEDLRLDADGVLQPPRRYARAGWYRDGVVPGDAGPAVVAGHVDSVDGPAVFYQLHALRPGDLVRIHRGDGWVTFRVTHVARYAKNRFPAAEVYRPTPGAELRLITCGGPFDRTQLSYRDNVVAYAVAV